jgi:cell division protein FtsQ
VRLPEAGVEDALDTLATLDRQKNLITRDVVIIDLRLSDRVSVQLSDAAAQARIDALKEQPKKKAGHA